MEESVSRPFICLYLVSNTVAELLYCKIIASGNTILTTYSATGGRLDGLAIFTSLTSLCLS